MATEMITDFDAITGQSTIRPATDEELKQKVLLQAEAETKVAEAEAKATAKAALLDRLGITAEEAALLLG